MLEISWLDDSVSAARVFHIAILASISSFRIGEADATDLKPSIDAIRVSKASVRDGTGSSRMRTS